MTTGQPIKNPSDKNKFQNEFMDSLRRQIRLNDTNLQANRLYQNTGQLPPSVQMADTRSITEKLADIEGLKQNIIADFKLIAEPSFASNIVQYIMTSPLNVDNSLIRFLAQNAPQISQQLSKKYKYGIRGDANDCEIITNFISDAYNSMKNSMQSIKGYINTSNESKDTRNNILTSNDMDRIKVELLDFTKRLHIMKIPDNMIAQISPRINTLIQNISRIKNYLPNTEQLNEIMQMVSSNPLMPPEHVINRRYDEQEDIPYQSQEQLKEVFKILSDLPRFKSVQTLLSQLYESTKNSNLELFGQIMTNINSLFNPILAGRNADILANFGNYYMNAANHMNQLKSEQSINDIRELRRENVTAAKAQRVYVVNPNDDPVKTVGADYFNHPEGAENAGEFRSLGPQAPRAGIPFNAQPVQQNVVNNILRGVQGVAYMGVLAGLGYVIYNAGQVGQVGQALQAIQYAGQALQAGQVFYNTVSNTYITLQQIYTAIPDLRLGNVPQDNSDEKAQEYADMPQMEDLPPKFTDIQENKNLPSSTYNDFYGVDYDPYVGQYDLPSSGKKSDAVGGDYDKSSISVGGDYKKLSPTPIDDYELPEYKYDPEEYFDPKGQKPYEKFLAQHFKEYPNTEIRPIGMDDNTIIGLDRKNQIRRIDRGAYLQQFPNFNIATLRAVTGTGLKRRIKKGRGLSSDYRDFGINKINHKKLNDGILTVRRGTNSNIPDMPSKRISRKLQKIITSISGGGMPDFNDINNLDNHEKDYLHKLICKSNLSDRLSVPAPSKDQEEKDFHQFEVMKGEIMSGNDSKEMIKKFKILILKLSKQNILPKNEVQEILEDLLSLGY